MGLNKVVGDSGRSAESGNNPPLDVKNLEERTLLLIPIKQRRSYASALAKLFGAGLPQDALEEYRKALELIPDGQRLFFVSSSLLVHLSAGGLRTRAEWSRYSKALEQVPPDYRTTFTWDFLTEKLGEGKLKTDEDWRKAVEEFNEAAGRKNP